MTTRLTQVQQAILTHAIKYTNGEIIWFPDHIKGGARNKVMQCLSASNLIMRRQQKWFVTPQGCAALDIEYTPALMLEVMRKSKQTKVIEMLKRTEGATIAQIVEETGWQEHTVRATFTNAFKKKLGLNLTSSKESGAKRVYRITPVTD